MKKQYLIKRKKHGGNPLLVAALASPVIGKLIDWIRGKGKTKKKTFKKKKIKK
jgi:hypothetical protein